MTEPEKSTFHTDQNRWENRDYVPEKKTSFEEFQDMINENEESASFQGHPDQPDIHDDDFQQAHLSRIRGDEEIEQAVKELLHNSKKLDASDITVIVDKCNVTLSGSVRSQAERDYAVEIVKLVHGVGNVHSEIIVNLNAGILPTSVGRNP